MKATKTKKSSEETFISNFEYKSILRSIDYLKKSGKSEIWEKSLTQPTKEKLINDGYKLKKIWLNGYKITW